MRYDEIAALLVNMTILEADVTEGSVTLFHATGYFRIAATRYENLSRYVRGTYQEEAVGAEDAAQMFARSTVLRMEVVSPTEHRFRCQDGTLITVSSANQRLTYHVRRAIEEDLG